jgi:hypothetical protein
MLWVCLRHVLLACAYASAASAVGMRGPVWPHPPRGPAPMRALHGGLPTWARGYECMCVCMGSTACVHERSVACHRGHGTIWSDAVAVREARSGALAFSGAATRCRQLLTSACCSAATVLDGWRQRRINSCNQVRLSSKGCNQVATNWIGKEVGPKQGCTVLCCIHLLLSSLNVQRQCDACIPSWHAVHSTALCTRAAGTTYNAHRLAKHHWCWQHCSCVP